MLGQNSIPIPKFLVRPKRLAQLDLIESFVLHLQHPRHLSLGGIELESLAEFVVCVWALLMGGCSAAFSDFEIVEFRGTGWQ